MDLIGIKPFWIIYVWPIIVKKPCPFIFIHYCLKEAEIAISMLHKRSFLISPDHSDLLRERNIEILVTTSPEISREEICRIFSFIYHLIDYPIIFEINLWGNMPDSESICLSPVIFDDQHICVRHRGSKSERNVMGAQNLKN